MEPEVSPFPLNTILFVFAILFKYKLILSYTLYISKEFPFSSTIQLSLSSNKPVKVYPGISIFSSVNKLPNCTWNSLNKLSPSKTLIKNFIMMSTSLFVDFSKSS